MAILTDKRHITHAGLANKRVVLALSPRKRKGNLDNGIPFDACCTRSKNDRVDDTERVPKTAHNMSSRPAMAKLIFEFVGGPHDGRILFGIVGEASDAERFFLFSNWGAVGQRFKVASEYAVEILAKERLKDERRHCFQPHFYVVFDRFEDDGEVWVRAEYDPQATTNERTVRQ